MRTGYPQCDVVRIIPPSQRATHIGEWTERTKNLRLPTASLKTAHKRVDKQAEAITAHQDKAAESGAKGHGKRPEQRQGKLVILAQELTDAKTKHA